MIVEMARGPVLMALFGLAAAAAGAGCSDDSVLRRLPDPVTQVDELKQKPAALVDILWVIDSSGSMGPSQANLAANLNKFITGLTVCPASADPNDLCDFTTKKCTVSGTSCNPPDYHLGVITMDVFASVDKGKLRRVGRCVPAFGATPSGGKYRYCQGSSVECTHNPIDPASDPANRVCDLTSPLAFVTPMTPGGANAFQRLVRVGVDGSGYEVGIRTLSMALGKDWDKTTNQFRPAPPENGGFFRPDASLFVLFVSDDDDESFGEVSYFYRLLQGVKGAGNEGLISISAITGDPIYTPSNTMTPTRGGCPAPPAPKAGEPGPRYISLAMYSRGLRSEFRTCDDKRLKCPGGQACQMPVPNLPGFCAPSLCSNDQDCGNFRCGDAGCINCEAGKCTLKPERFVDLLGKTGIFGSICAQDYGVVLGNLGFEAAGLRRKFELTKYPDCAQKVKCCKAGIDDASCTVDKPVCVKVNGEPIENDRTSGWIYESSSNAVFFDGAFIPPTDAPIQISYRIARASTALSCGVLK